MDDENIKKVRFAPVQDHWTVDDVAHSKLNLPDKWLLLPAFVKTKGLVKQHLDSYNFFVKTEIKQIVRAQSNRFIKSDIDPRFYIEFLDINIGPPRLEEARVKTKLTPMLCRKRDITYSSPILVDVEVYREDKSIRRQNVEIGRMPVMLKSCVCVLSGKSPEEMVALEECPYDPGGYFVVKGTERVVLMQEQLSKNRIIVEEDFKKMTCAVVTSASAESKTRTLVVVKQSKLYLRHNTFGDDVPLVVALKAMGMETDQEFFQLVGDHNVHFQSLSLSVQECRNDGVLTQNNALLFLGKKIKARMARFNDRPGSQEKIKSDAAMKQDAISALNRLVLSHIECPEYDLRAKIRYLCMMANRALNADKDKKKLDDRDYYGNKRLELAGQLISILFEDLFKRFASATKKQADAALTSYMTSKSSSSRSKDSLQYPDCFRNIPVDIITRGLQSSLSTGNWNIKRFAMERSGVSQVLNRLSYIATLGMMTRINSQFEKGRKVSGPRALQPSQWGMLCPCDTPEGEACGLVKNLSLLTHVTTDMNIVGLKRVAYSLGVEDADLISGEEIGDPGTFSVFMNGNLLGVHRRPQYFMSNIRNLRRYGKIGEFVSIYTNEGHKAIYIASDGGRLCRPLIIVEDGKPHLTEAHMLQMRRGELTFGDFLRNGILEWIDVNEENNLFIAIREVNIDSQTTHLEIEPLAIMGVVAGLVPYPHHNQSPRNTYQCAMGKQAMGAIALNQFHRADTLLYALVYPQRPLCKTRTIEFVNFENLPAGQNASVAVMSFSGYDIEDAIVMNRASIDRGFGRCFVFKRTVVDMKRYHNGSCDRNFPPPIAQGRSGDASIRGSGVSRRFQVLEEDGVCRVGDQIAEDQIYVHRFMPNNTKDNIEPSKMTSANYSAKPVKYKLPVPSYVDRVIVTDNPENTRIYKIMLRQTRRPEYGDKFSSRHGQKGVVGLIIEQENMPFSESGWCPDLIMNPHGFPSRMTVGKMIELIAGKSALLDGNFKYGTAFGGTPVKDIGEILISKGFHYSGKEVLTSGITGELLQTYVFIGPLYYQKLKHMVQDKMHARGRGPRETLTRQPTEGRAKEGGLRLGEMERDCLVAYGASNLLLERLMLSSDVFEACVCGGCGFLGYNGFCSFCQTSQDVCTIKLPYACKLMFQELQAMNVSPRIRLKER
eukprot:GHVP01016885.1.p1 GENE.GHVP01016885.1~~GHVP01016885.1.p1  ORF type:complete len:1169 (+),score=208.31 GHVP01016885.1:1983-5489(+)